MPASPASSAWPRRRASISAGERGPADHGGGAGLHPQDAPVAEVVENGGNQVGAHHLPYYAQIWHGVSQLLQTVPVVSDDAELTAAAAEAGGRGPDRFAARCSLHGMSVPERM